MYLLQDSFVSGPDLLQCSGWSYVSRVMSDS